jgi:hypothetical protein
VSSVDVIPLGDTHRHRVPEGYDDAPEGWLVLERRVGGLFPPCWCKPWVEPTIDPNRGLHAIYVHRAYDGREAAEREAA